MLLLRHAPILFIASALQACAEFPRHESPETVTAESASAGNVHAPQVRDSAGVKIAEWPGDFHDLPPAFQIVAKPLMDLGGSRLGRPEELDPRYYDHTVVTLSDGRLVVPNGEVMVLYTPEGDVIRTIGTAGQGPGEFKRVDMVCALAEDSILAVDDRKRWHVFSEDGDFVRTVTQDHEFIPAGCTSSGTLLQLTTNADLSTIVRLASPDGLLSPAFHTFEAWSTYLPRVQNVVAHQSEIFLADGQVPEITVTDTRGTVIRIIRWEGPRVPVTEQMAERLALATIPLNRRTPDRVDAAVRRARADLASATLPMFGLLLVDDQSRLWIQDYSLGVGVLGAYPPAWTVLNPNGAPLGRVQLPPMAADPTGGTRRRLIDLRGAAGDRALVRWEDDLGFVHLSYHELQPAP